MEISQSVLSISASSGLLLVPLCSWGSRRNVYPGIVAGRKGCLVSLWPFVLNLLPLSGKSGLCWSWFFCCSNPELNVCGCLPLTDRVIFYLPFSHLYNDVSVWTKRLNIGTSDVWSLSILLEYIANWYVASESFFYISVRVGKQVNDLPSLD